MIISIFNAIASFFRAIAAKKELDATALIQRRQAESDISQKEMEAEKRADEIRTAVHEGDDTNLNRVVKSLMVILWLAVFGVMLGCALRSQQIIYIPTDRRIESCTNSIGIACKAVPNAVFEEMLIKLDQFKTLTKELSVERRISK